MLVRVLGAVELVASGGTAVSLPGARQPALLAALAARANEVVSTDRLVDLLWGDDLPANPEASCTAPCSLRGNLRAAGGREVLLTRDHGYQLALLPGDLDAERFTGLVRRRGTSRPSRRPPPWCRRSTCGAGRRTPASPTPRSPTWPRWVWRRPAVRRWSAWARHRWPADAPAR